MAETRTDLVINAKAKGFEEAQQKASKVVAQAAKAASEQAKGFGKLESSSRAYKKEIKALEKQLADLNKQQLATLKSMQGMDKSRTVWKQAKENLKDLGAEAARLNQTLAHTKEAFGPKGPSGKPLTSADMARGGFTQGLAQGFGVQLQRGPGMWRQAAGLAVGQMGRATLGAPFGGVSGLQNAVASIPGVGGFLGGQMGNAMQFAEGAMGVQQARLGAMPLFGGGGGAARRIAEARQKAEAGVNPEKFYAKGRTGFAGPGEDLVAGFRASAAAEKARAVKPTAASFWSSMGRASLATAGVAGGGIPTNKATTVATPGQAAIDAMEQVRAPEKAYREAQKAEGARAAARERGRPFDEVRREGQRLAGISEQQAIEAMSAVLQRGGGSIEEARNQGMVKAGFAAQTAYGIGPEVQGAFLQAGRRGGAVGAQGRSGEAMTEAISQGLSLGLQGSELQDYMAQMANDISSWKQTGLPINPRSIQQMGAAVSGTGLGGVRGAAISHGLAQAGQNLAAGGVQDTVDLLMMQTMGGYKGGGMEEYEKAQVQLEQMGGKNGWDADTLKNLTDQLMKAGGGGAGGRNVVQQAFRRKGVQMTKGETIAFTKAQAREELSKTEQEQMDKIQAQMKAGTTGAPQGVEGLEDQALGVMKAYGGHIEKAASLQNQQNAVGQKWIDTLQELQQSAQNINESFKNVAKDPVHFLAEGIEGFTKSLLGLTIKADDAATALGGIAKAF